MPRNPFGKAASGFRERLAGRSSIVGLFVKTASHQIVEVLGRTGLDCIVIDAEHAPFDRNALDLCLLAARACELPALVRVPEATEAAILGPLDMGADGVLLPRISTAEKAARGVGFAKYSRTRGFSSSSRAGDYGRSTMADHVRRSDEMTTVVAMIEDVKGVDRIEAICDVDGIDALFLGLADLTVSMGHTDSRHPLVEAAADRAFAVARARGMALGALVPDIGSIGRFRARGVSMFLVGTDQGILRTAVDNIVSATRAAA